MSDRTSPASKRRRGAHSCQGCRLARQRCELPAPGRIDWSGACMPAELSCHRCRILAADCVFVRSGASVPDRQEQKAKKTRRSRTAGEENAARRSQTQETGDERTTEADTFHQDAILQPREILDGDDRSSEPVRDSTAWLERTRSSFRSYSYLALVMRRLHAPREERMHTSLSLGSILAGANIDWARCGEVLDEMRVLEPYLPSLSQLRAGTDDDLLLAAVLLLTSSHIAEWRSQLSDFVQREVQHRVLYGPRGTYDIMALLLVSQCPNDVFPDAFQISALDGSGILAAGASACRTRRMDEISTPNDNATMLWACLCLQSSLNCIMEDVTRKPVAKMKNLEALGSENDLFKTRFRFIEEVRVLCRALADELCVEKNLATPQDACDKAKTCLHAVNQASSKHRTALRHGHPSHSALLAYLDLEQEIVHYAAISQIINILFRPFVYHVKEPVSSVDFFRSFHAQADYLDAFISVGSARIVAAKLLIYKYFALVRKNGRKHPLRPDVEPTVRQQTEQLDFLRPRNYFLYAALVAAAKAVAEECSGRWFAGHVPDAGEEMALWHGNLLLLERLQRDIIGLPRGTQLLETIVKALRQTVLTLGAWIEAAERQALRGTFPRLIADTTSGADAEASSFDDFRLAETFINDILDGDILGSPSDFLHPPFSLREASPLTQSFPL